VKIPTWMPERLEIRTEDSEHDLVIVDPERDFYQSAIFLSLGHRMTDMPNEQLKALAEKLCELYNEWRAGHE
jgi:hypothetical protein